MMEVRLPAALAASPTSGGIGGGVRSRAEMVRRLVELDLTDCAIDAAALQYLYDALVVLEAPLWRSLSLASNPIGTSDGGMMALGEVLRLLRDAPLAALNLRECGIASEALFSLHGPLRGLRRLRSLDVSHNRFVTPEVFSVVADIDGIEALNLSSNGIALVSLSDVAPQFARMTSVTNLDLSFNHIDEVTIRQIKKLLPRSDASLLV